MQSTVPANNLRKATRQRGVSACVCTVVGTPRATYSEVWQRLYDRHAQLLRVARVEEHTLQARAAPEQTNELLRWR